MTQKFNLHESKFYLQHFGVKSLIRLLIRRLVIMPLPRRPTSLLKFPAFDS